MRLNNERELSNTRKKLRMLEEDYDALSSESSDDEELRELTMESIKRLANQLKEEIARYEAHHHAARP